MSDHDFIVERRDDGLYLVGAAPLVIELAHDLIVELRGAGLVEKNVITFALANGTWRYRIRYYDVARRVTVAERADDLWRGGYEQRQTPTWWESAK